MHLIATASKISFVQPLRRKMLFSASQEGTQMHQISHDKQLNICVAEARANTDARCVAYGLDHG